MKEVVINTCYGGFGLSEKAVMRYAELKGIKLYMWKESNLFARYTTVPQEQYQALHDECKKKGNYKEINEKEWYFAERHIPRDDPFLVQVVRELGEESWGDCAKLEIVEIPEDVQWHIEEYDGTEHIAENHRTWR